MKIAINGLNNKIGACYSFDEFSSMASLEIIRMKEALIGVFGLGYVGLPLVIEFCKSGFPVMGFDWNCMLA